MTNDRFAFVQFCDDIRFEVGNKTSLMGLYTGELTVSGFPAALPKLCCAVTLVWPIAEAPSSIKAAITLGDDTLLSETIPDNHIATVLAGLRTNRAEGDEAPTQFAVAMHFALTPLNLATETKLLVTLNVDGEEFKAGSLRIKRGNFYFPSHPA